jgi:putative peptide zinc metalloprotease protein
LLVLWPLLWTDTTEAWKLTDRRQRMAIDAAGVAAELVLAVVATLAWCVLSDGPLRSGVFLLSSTTWLVTVAVNLNPLMRFDGYYLLSDLLGVPNLQQRGFAIARWRLREWLFGLGAPTPETMAPGVRHAVITWAFATWIYRFTLFLGIALLVYHLAFKLLGVFLMGVELWWFIIRPIARELLTWHRLVPTMWPNWHLARTALLALALLAALFIPWRGEIAAPALLRAQRQETMLAPEGGILRHLAANEAQFASGDVVAELVSPSIEHTADSARLRIEGLRARIAGLAFDPDRGDGMEVAWQELQDAIAELEAANAQRAALIVRAPFAGVLVDRPPELRPGTPVKQHELLGILIDPTDAVVDAYVEESDVGRVHIGAAARFIPTSGEASLPLRVVEVAPAPVRSLDPIELASVNGGPVRVRRDHAGALIPEVASTLVRLVPIGISEARLRERGTVVIDGDRESISAKLVRRGAAVVLRESGL